jgi:hypothetical protein
LPSGCNHFPSNLSGQRIDVPRLAGLFFSSYRILFRVLAPCARVAGWNADQHLQPFRIAVNSIALKSQQKRGTPHDCSKPADTLPCPALPSSFFPYNVFPKCNKMHVRSFFIPVEAEEKSKPADINIEVLQEFLGILSWRGQGVQ